MRNHRIVREWVSRFLASDPGLTRLRMALQAVVSIGVVLLLEYLFAVLAHPLMLPADDPGAAAQNHAITVMAMMTGAMVVMPATFAGPMFDSLSSVLLGLALLPVAMFAGVTIGLLAGGIPPLALTAMVVILGGVGFLRRFGPWGFVIGQGLFMGNFLGFFLGRITDASGLGTVAVELCIGAVVAMLAQIVLFAPSRRTAVRRLRRSFLSRADQVAAATIDMLEHPHSTRFRGRQHRRVVALNEAALMLDAQLADSPRLPVGTTAGQLHRNIFSAELALSNAARFARTLVRDEAPPAALTAVHAPMEAVLGREPRQIERSGRALRERLRDSDENGTDPSTLVILHRYATSIIDYAQALDILRQHRFSSRRATPRDRQPSETVSTDTRPFEAAVSLAGGWLPGSSAVSATASKESAAQRVSTRLEPSTRAGIQMTLAAAASVLIGVLVSPDRFYWAVLATFVTFMGANNAAEHVRKGAFRVIGTVAGIVLGTLVAHVVGDRPALSIIVILLTLFIGLYLMRVSYAFFATAITVLVAQLYVQLGELSDQLLGLRLLETFVGAVVAALTVVLVLPLRTDRVVRVATREFVEALSALISPAIRILRDREYTAQLQSATRDLDAAFQTLEASTAPGRAMLRLPGSLGGVERQWWFAANAAHSYARDLVIDASRSDHVPEDIGDSLGEAGQQMLASANELARGLTEHATDRSYIRAASRFERIAADLDDHHAVTSRQLALLDLQHIDGALAGLAKSSGLAVTSSS